MMANNVREAVEKVFDRLESMPEEELLDAIDNHPKTEWFELLEEMFAESTLDEVLELQNPSGYTQTECISEKTKEQKIQSIQKDDDYSVKTACNLTVSTNNPQDSYKGIDPWLAEAA